MNMDFDGIFSDWLDKNGVKDKDAELVPERAGAGRPAAAETRRRRLKKKSDAVIDIHGLTRNEAWDALDAFFEQGRREGFEKLGVIHGKGNHSSGEAVLKGLTRDFIERCSFAGESGHGAAADGGAGMTWVLLKK
jgi:DNA-nicking Smr family endonuclease